LAEIEGYKSGVLPADAPAMFVDAGVRQIRVPTFFTSDKMAFSLHHYSGFSLTAPIIRLHSKPEKRQK